MRWLFWIVLLGLAVALLRSTRRTTALGLVGGLSVVSTTGLVLAVLLASSVFGILRLLTDLIFLAVPAFLVLGSRSVEPKWARRTARIAALLLGGAGLWSTQIEPHWLEVTPHRIESRKLERAVRLVVVSDLQTDRWGAFQARVVDEIVRQKPDIVLMTGDYVQVGGAARRHVVESLRRALADSSLRPVYGVHAVGGDVEVAGWEADFRGTVVETYPSTTRFETAGITFTALEARDSRHRAPSGLGPVQPSERFHIAFGHAPDFALAAPPADLMLAGHVHGGQVRLPLWGPLLTFSAVPRDWAVGRTDFVDGRTLIVSRGLGMERGQAPRVRFLCRPELVVIDLVPAD